MDSQAGVNEEYDDEEAELDRIVSEACQYLPASIQASVEHSIEYAEYFDAGRLLEGAVYGGFAGPREEIRTAILELKGEVEVRVVEEIFRKHIRQKRKKLSSDGSGSVTEKRTRKQ